MKRKSLDGGTGLEEDRSPGDALAPWHAAFGPEGVLPDQHALWTARAYQLRVIYVSAR